MRRREIYVKYSLSPRGEPEGFLEGSVYISPYFTVLPNNGSYAAVAVDAVFAVAANVNFDLAVDLIASVEVVSPAMLTHSHSNRHTHGRYFNHPSIQP